MGTIEPSLTKAAVRRRRWIFSLLSCLGVLAIVVVSFLPVRDKSSLHTRGRLHSPGHLVAFGLVAFLIGGSVRSPRARVVLAVVMVLLGFGVELGEYLTFKAPLEWKDVLMDVVGIAGGTLLALAVGERDA